MRVLELVSELLDFPVLIFLFGGVAFWISLRGLRASPEKLAAMAGHIGTKNPKTARLVCWIGLILGGVTFVAGGIAFLRESGNLLQRIRSEGFNLSLIAFALTLACLFLAWFGLKGLFASRENTAKFARRLPGNFGNHPRAVRSACLLVGVIGAVLGIRFMVGEPEDQLARRLITEGVIQQAGRQPDQITIDRAEDGTYQGTARFGAEPWEIRGEFVQQGDTRAFVWQAAPVAQLQPHQVVMPDQVINHPVPIASSPEITPPPSPEVAAEASVDALANALVEATKQKLTADQLAGDVVDGLSLGQRRQIFSALYRAEFQASQAADRQFPVETAPRDQFNETLARRNELFQTLKARGRAPILQRFQIDESRAQAIEAEADANSWSLD